MDGGGHGGHGGHGGGPDGAMSGGNRTPSPPVVTLTQCDAQAIVAERPWSDKVLNLALVVVVALFFGLFLWFMIFDFTEDLHLPAVSVLPFVALFVLWGYAAITPVALRIDVPTRTYSESRNLPPFRKVTVGGGEDFDRLVLREFRHTSPSPWVLELEGGVCGKAAYPLSSVNSREKALGQAREMAALLRLPLTDEKGEGITDVDL